MNTFLANMIIILIIAVLLTVACRYIYKEKKKGRHCIGCPMAGKCPRSQGCSGQCSK